MRLDRKSIFFFLLLAISAIFPQRKDYTKLFKDTTYRNYWFRYNALKGLCKEPDKNYKTLLLAFEHKEEPVSELATDCLTDLKNKKNINDFVKKYVDGVSDTAVLKKSLFVVSRLAKDKLIEMLGKTKDNNIKLLILEYLLDVELGENDLKIIHNEYLKGGSSILRFAAMDILLKYNYIKEMERYLKSNDKNDRIYGIKWLCSVNKERCIKVLLEEIQGKFSNNTDYFCNLIHIIKRYNVEEVLNELLTNVVKINDYLKKKMIFSALVILSEESFKEKVKQFWKDLSTNFLSLLFNIYSIKFNTYELNLDDIYRNIKDTGKGGEFKTSSVPIFFTMPVYGRNIAFVIDMSGSMTKKVRNTDKNITRFDLAKKELEKVLGGLGINVKFNIVLINSETDILGIRVFSKNFVKSDKNQIKNAVNYLDNAWKKLQQVKRGRTDIYDALKVAMELPAVDTIILLTDGNPTWGKYTLAGNIITSITKLNRCKFISINSVAVGATRYGMEFLQKLSINNYGIMKEAGLGEK